MKFLGGTKSSHILIAVMRNEEHETNVEEDRLTAIHRKFRQACIDSGTYRPITEEELEREIARWRAEASRPERVGKQKRARRR